MIPSAVRRAIWHAIYNGVALPLVALALPLAAMRSAKLRATLAGHRGLWARLEAALAARDPARPLLWFHVASAGEFLQGLPVLERCAAEGWQSVLTVTSVSGLPWAEKRMGEVPGLLAVDYLPLDTRANMRRLLGMLQPAALVFTKYDVWPNLVWEAQRARVHQFLLAGTLHARSWRTRWAIARSLYRTLYEPLTGIFAVTEADAARFLEAAPGHPGVTVVGDTRYDSVLQRRERIAPPPLPPYRREEGTVLVVGSAWPADEQRIFPGLVEALERYAALRLVLVPHETDANHLAAIEAAFEAWAPLRFTALQGMEAGQAPHWRVLLVDTVGQLSALYAHAALAYVGGAFTTGVHNVMEPAAMGVPPIFGPLHHNAPEAMHLVQQGLAFAIQDADAFRSALFALLDDPPRRTRLGVEARAYIESQAGAAGRSWERIRAALATAGVAGVTEG